MRGRDGKGKGRGKGGGREGDDILARGRRT